LLVFVQLVIAAMTTSPCLMSKSLPFHLTGTPLKPRSGRGGGWAACLGFDFVAAFAFPAALGELVDGGCWRKNG
jgi:hypothetical protein